MNFGDRLKQFLFGVKQGVQQGISDLPANLGNFGQNIFQAYARSPIAQGVENFQTNVENRTLPKVNLTQYTQNIQNPVLRFGAGLGTGAVESFVNMPQRLAESGGRWGLIGRDIIQGKNISAPRVIGAAASSALPLLDIATLGGGTIAKQGAENIIKQAGKQTLKQAAKEGLLKGMGWGALYGGLGGLAEGDSANFGNFAKGAGTGAVVGGALGGITGGASGLYALLKRTPQAEKELTELASKQLKTPNGEYIYEGLKKPKGLTVAQWDYQLKFNKQYKRNPYTPVYPSDVSKALDYEIKKKGVGFSIRDISQDENPLGTPSTGGGGQTAFKNKEFNFVRNPEKAPNMGNRFGQNIEPAGKYINLMDEGQTYVPPGWETGKVTFKNPLVVEWGGGYGEVNNWKNVLSKRYGGKTGKALSEAIKKDGFDGIITLDKGKPSEVVSLSTGSTGGGGIEDKNLVAMHNIKPEGVIHANKMGGLPLPSIAISRKEYPLEGFGDISLIGDKNLINPTIKSNKVFNADAYSPRYPQVNYSYVAKAADERLSPIINETRKYFKDNRAVIPNYLDNYGNPYRAILEGGDFEGRGLDTLENNSVIKGYFAMKKGAKPDADYRQISDIIDRNRGEYTNFVEKLFNDISDQERLFKGYTESGNRRYAPHTLENVVKEMKSQMSEGENFNYGLGSVRSKVAKKYNTLSDIKADRNKIISKTDFEKVRNDLDKEWEKILDNAVSHYSRGDEMGAYDTFTNVLMDGIKKGNIKGELETYGFKGLNVENINKFLQKVREAPTEYFEVKPQRAVGLNEFKGALVPKDIDPRVSEILQSKGLKIVSYDPQAPKDRIIKLQDNFGNEMFGATLGIEPYYDEKEKKYKIRYNSEKAMLGIALMGGIKYVKNKRLSSGSTGGGGGAEKALIDTAKSFGVDSVIPNEKQLKDWTVNQIASGNKNVLEHLRVVQKAGKPVSISKYISGTGGGGGAGKANWDEYNRILDKGQDLYNTKNPIWNKSRDKIILDLVKSGQKKVGYPDSNLFNKEFISEAKKAGLIIEDFIGTPIVAKNKADITAYRNVVEGTPQEWDLIGIKSPAPSTGGGGGATRVNIPASPGQLTPKTPPELPAVQTPQPVLNPNNGLTLSKPQPPETILKPEGQLGQIKPEGQGQLSPPKPEGSYSSSIAQDANGLINKIKTKANQLYTETMDRFHPLSVMAKKAGEDQAMRNAMTGYYGAGSTANYHVDFELAPILKEQNINDLRRAAVAMRDVELQSRNIKGSNTGEAIANLEKLKAELGPEKMQAIGGTLQKLYQYQDNIVKTYLVDSGIISKEAYTKMRANNQFYIPFKRVMDTVDEFLGTTPQSRGAGSVGSQNVIYGIKGSDKQIVDPIESIIESTYKSVGLGQRQKVAQTIVSLKDKLPQGMISEIKGPTGNKPNIALFENGKVKHYSVPSEVADAAKGLSEEALNTVVKILAYPTKIFRATATGINPEFMAPNVARDLQSAFVNAGLNPLKWVKGFAHQLRKDEVYQEFLKAGGKTSRISIDRPFLKKTVEEVSKTSPPDRNILVSGLKFPFRVIKGGIEGITHPSKIKDLLQTAGEYSEQPTRIAVFEDTLNKGLKQGLTRQEASIRAANAAQEASVNFARRGSKTQSINAIYAFLNARAQGVDRLIRTVKNDPKGASIRIGMITVAPALALYAYNRNFQSYNDPRVVSQTDKDNNFIIMLSDKPIDKLGGAQFIKIPKGDVGKLANPLESFLSYSEGKGGDIAKSIQSSLKAFSPIDNTGDVIPTALRPVVENTVNKSFFTGQNIVPDYKKNYPAGYQDNSSTSPTYRAIGQKLNVSPAKTQALVEGYGTGIAKLMTNLTDRFMPDQYKTAKNGQGQDINRTPVIRRFLGGEKKTLEEQNLSNQKQASSITFDINDIKAGIKRGDLPYEVGIKKIEELQNKQSQLLNGTPTGNSNFDKLKFQSSGQSSATIGNSYYYYDAKGRTQSIDLSFQPTEPTLSGNTLLDKKAISKFNGEITQKANDIYELYKQGQLSQSEAEKQLTELQKLKDSYSKPKSLKSGKGTALKIKQLKYKQPKFKKFTFKKPSITAKTLKLPALKVQRPAEVNFKALSYKGKPLKIKAIT